MKVLVLQQPSSTARVDHWIADAARDLGQPAIEIVVVTGAGSHRAADDYAAGTRVHTVDQYFSPLADSEISRLAFAWGPDRVVSNAELDVLRAATLRSVLGLPGLRAGLALRFRDKLAMKTLFTDAGLASPGAVGLGTVDDLVAALDRFGEVVVKPRGGFGSRGVRMLDDPAHLRDALAADVGLLAALNAGELLAEERVEGEVFHVDAVLDGAEVLLCAVSRYLSPPHTFATVDTASALVDEDSALHGRIVAATGALAGALPAGHGVGVIHLEFYRTPSEVLLAGEVAARLGGGMIKQTIRQAYGLDLSHEGYLLAAGLGAAGRLRPAPRPARRGAVGFRLFTSGTPESVPLAEPPEWMHGLWVQPRSGGDHPTSSVDATGGFLATGADEAEVSRRLRSVH